MRGLLPSLHGPIVLRADLFSAAAPLGSAACRVPATCSFVSFRVPAARLPRRGSVALPA